MREGSDRPSDKVHLDHFVHEFAEDGTSPTTVIQASYPSNSDAAGKPHDWSRFRNLFLPTARIEAVLSSQSGQPSRQVFSVDEYIARANPNLEQRGFQEEEIGRQIVQYGAIAQVRSVYEAHHGSGSEMMIIRGINSFQLVQSDRRWWITSLIWTNERIAGPLPHIYLNLADDAQEK